VAAAAVAGVQPAAAGTLDRPLDLLNFFLADVRDGLGPYLAIYLLAVQHWDAASIGIVMSVGGLAGIVAQTPAGWLVDRSHRKRLVLIVAAVAVTACSVILPLMQGVVGIGTTQALVGASGAVFAPLVAAITLGIVGPRAFTTRTGRNEAFNHAGNAFAATTAGGLAYFLGPIVVFYLMAAMAVASIAATLAIPARAIDDEVARGLIEDPQAGHGVEHPSGLKALLENRHLLVFAACCALFHFANAAMLPLVGQKLALGAPGLGTTLMSVCIVGAQLVMVPMAMLVGARADRWGRKPLFLAGFLILPLRGVLYTFSDDPYWLLAVQLLDGVGAGMFGALFPLIVADLTRGTGRFNVSQGAITAAQGIGAALSTTVAGFIVTGAGYSTAFLVLAAVAAAALVLFWIAMPETAERGIAHGSPTHTLAISSTPRWAAWHQTPLRIELDIPVEIVPPALVQVVGRERAAVVPELVRARYVGLGHRVHAALAGQAVALAQVAAGAGGEDVGPGRPPAARARHQVVEGELVGRKRPLAVLAGEPVAQEDVEPGEGWAAVLRDVLLQCHYRGQAQFEAGRADGALIMRDHGHPVEEDGLDRFLPIP
jgi:MFS family permease